MRTSVDVSAPIASPRRSPPQARRRPEPAGPEGCDRHLVMDLTSGRCGIRRLAAGSRGGLIGQAPDRPVEARQAVSPPVRRLRAGTWKSSVTGTIRPAATGCRRAGCRPIREASSGLRSRSVAPARCGSSRARRRRNRREARRWLHHGARADSHHRAVEIEDPQGLNPARFVILPGPAGRFVWVLPASEVEEVPRRAHPFSFHSSWCCSPTCRWGRCVEMPCPRSRRWRCPRGRSPRPIPAAR